MRTLLLTACLLLATSPADAAVQSPPPQPTPTPAAREASAPVPVPSPSEKAMSYYRSGNALWVINLVWGFAVPALFLFTGLSARIRNWAARLGRKWFFIVGLYFIIFALLNFVLDLPLGYYEGYAREHAYGLSNQTFGKWFGDEIKGLAVSLVAGCLLLWIPYLLLRRSPRRWWLYTGLLAVPLLFLMILITPVWVDPLFNEFGPMRDQALEARILGLAERAGIEGGRVYEVNKSVDTKALNAYVTGFADTKRIVLWDTIIARLEEPELLFVMGDEMGPYVLGHGWKSIFCFSAVILATLYAIHRTAGWLIGKYRHRFGFESLADVASLPLILLLFSSYIFLVTPIALAFSRHHEHESDRFGLEITRDNRAAATAFVKLQEENLGNPRPGLLVKLWRASHPPLGERIDFCNTYRPWERNEPLVYGHLFRETKAQAP